MPIVVKVVSDQEFSTWVEAAKKKFASAKSDTLASVVGAAQ
jgi:cytochrome c oxidase subunit 2